MGVLVAAATVAGALASSAWEWERMQAEVWAWWWSAPDPVPVTLPARRPSCSFNLSRPDRAPAPPASATAIFYAIGDVEGLWWRDSVGAMFDAAQPVPPGRYEVLAAFREVGLMRVGTLEAEAGRRYTFECKGVIATCRSLPSRSR